MEDISEEKRVSVRGYEPIGGYFVVYIGDHGGFCLDVWGTDGEPRAWKGKKYSVCVVTESSNSPSLTISIS